MNSFSFLGVIWLPYRRPDNVHLIQGVVSDGRLSSLVEEGEHKTGWKECCAWRNKQTSGHTEAVCYPQSHLSSCSLFKILIKTPPSSVSLFYPLSITGLFLRHSLGCLVLSIHELISHHSLQF